jgi:hypothetical protein
VTRGTCLRLARKLKEQRRIAADFDRPRVEELGGDQRLALGQQPVGRLQASERNVGRTNTSLGSEKNMRVDDYSFSAYFVKQVNVDSAYTRPEYRVFRYDETVIENIMLIIGD